MQREDTDNCGRAEQKVVRQSDRYGGGSTVQLTVSASDYLTINLPRGEAAQSSLPRVLKCRKYFLTLYLLSSAALMASTGGITHDLTHDLTLIGSSPTASSENTGHNFTLSGPISGSTASISSSGNESEKIQETALGSKRPELATLDPATYKKLVDIRTTILLGGIYGMTIGCFVGFAIHRGIDRLLIKTGLTKKFSARFKERYPAYTIPHKFPRHSLLPTVLFFGAIVSFSSASVNGRSALNKVGDMWSLNSKPKSAYQQQMNEERRALLKSAEESFDRRITSIREGKAIKEELEKWGPPTK